MTGKGKFLLGLLGLVVVLYSFLLNTHVADLLLDPANGEEAIIPVHHHPAHLPVAYFHSHHSTTKHLPAPVQQKHSHSKHKSAKHGGSIKCTIDRYEMVYTRVHPNCDIHTAGQTSYQYVFFREINPPPPKIS